MTIFARDSDSSSPDCAEREFEPRMKYDRSVHIEQHCGNHRTVLLLSCARFHPLRCLRQVTSL